MKIEYFIAGVTVYFFFSLLKALLYPQRWKGGKININLNLMRFYNFNKDYIESI